MYFYLLLGMIAASNFKYHKYSEIYSFFQELEKDYPQQIKIHYPLTNVTNTRKLKCGTQECVFFYAEININEETQTDLPTVLIVGGFHGNEVIGTNVITELAQYILKGQDILSVLYQRKILLYPMVNPEGYYFNKREELGIDVNRDFPIDNSHDKCFQSNSARALSHIYQNYQIELGITFHGGDNSITYPWGTMNHIKDQKATEAPDDSAFNFIAKILKQVSSKNENFKMYPYQMGRMTDIVYPVNGGYEDWSYAGAWSEVTAKCNGIDSSEIKNDSINARSLTFLVEAGYDKFPDAQFWGSKELFEEQIKNWPPKIYFNDTIIPEGYGHINRNLLLSLTLIDLAKPYLVVRKSKDSITIQVGGCKKVEFIQLNNETLEVEIGGIWNEIKKSKIAIPVPNQNEFNLTYSCDFKLNYQLHPDPNIKPQSFFMKNRQNYTQSFKLEDIQEEIENSNDNSLSSENIQDQNKGNNNKKIIYFILVIFITASILFSIGFYKYCKQKKTKTIVMDSFYANNI